MTGALPSFLIIGGMKCGTTALHSLLDRHPQVAMSRPKELNFFFGTDPPTPDTADPWAAGNHWRGVDWYAAHFPADMPIRGDASPGYSSPSHPDVARLAAAVVPDARLVHLVRDPIERAASQFRHHQRDGTEQRSLADALLDPGSQYVARSRYHERLLPFLRWFPREQLLIVGTEQLRSAPQATVTRVLTFVGADPRALPAGCLPAPAPATPVTIDPALRRRLVPLLRDDANRLRDVAGHRFPDWSL